MERIETRVTYLLIGLAAGALIATIFPPVQHWPELETRLEITDLGIKK